MRKSTGLSGTCRLVDAFLPTIGLDYFLLNGDIFPHNFLRKVHMSGMSERIETLLRSSSLSLSCGAFMDDIEYLVCEKYVDIVDCARGVSLSFDWFDIGRQDERDFLDLYVIPLVQSATITHITIYQCTRATSTTAGIIEDLLRANVHSVECFDLDFWCAKYSKNIPTRPLPILPALTTVQLSASDNETYPRRECPFPVNWICRAASPRILKLDGFKFDCTLQALQQSGSTVTRLTVGKWYSDFAALLPNLLYLKSTMRPGCRLRKMPSDDTQCPVVPATLQSLEFWIFDGNVHTTVLDAFPAWLADSSWCSKLHSVTIEVRVKDIAWIEAHVPALRALPAVCAVRGIDLSMFSMGEWGKSLPLNFGEEATVEELP